MTSWFSGGSSDSSASGVAPQVAAEARNAAVSVPVLRPGDRFTFSNPEVTWEVVAVTPDERVAWRADDGETQITSTNPLLPALEWHSTTRGNGKRLISAMSEPMFPMETGKTTTFRSTVDTDTPPYAWEFDWRCHTGKLEAVTVPAGSFAAYRVECGRQQPDELIFYYSPVVGNYVRMLIADSEGGPPAERVLLAYARAGGSGMQTINAAAPAGEVTMDPVASAEMEADVPLPASSYDPNKGVVGPTVLGMAAGVPQAAPTTAPTSDLTAPMASSGTAAETTTAMAPATTTGSDGAASGTIAVHLTSYRKPENAERGWAQLVAANRDLLQGTRPIIRQVDIPGKGLYYRLHAGPIANEAQARTLCSSLTQRGVYCKVMKL